MHWESFDGPKGQFSTAQAYRTAVPGGWLVFVGWNGQESGLTFVPDPEHAWDITTDDVALGALSMSDPKE